MCVARPPATPRIPSPRCPASRPPRARRGEPSPYALDGFCSVTPEDPLENQLADAMGGLRCSRATRASESTPAPPLVPQQQKAVEELASSMVSPMPLPKCERLRSCAIRSSLLHSALWTCKWTFTTQMGGYASRRPPRDYWAPRPHLRRRRGLDEALRCGFPALSHASVTAACRPIPTYVALSLPPPQLTVDPQFTTGARVTTLGEGCDAEQGRLPSAKV